jgi:hypothetical protein
MIFIRHNNALPMDGASGETLRILIEKYAPHSNKAIEDTNPPVQPI